jgi:hypothetical protein
MQPQPEPNVLDRFFAGLSEQVFHGRLGIVDTELVDYISDLLVRFTKTDSLHRIRQLDGRPATEVVTLISEAEARVGVARREVHRHIGDFTLFWSGLYPEALQSLQGERRGDRLVSYHEEGKRAYALASSIDVDADTRPPAELLQRLSHDYDMCVFGLQEVRRIWESEGPASGSSSQLLI